MSALCQKQSFTTATVPQKLPAPDIASSTTYGYWASMDAIFVRELSDLDTEQAV